MPYTLQTAICGILFPFEEFDVHVQHSYKHPCPLGSTSSSNQNPKQDTPSGPLDVRKLVRCLNGTYSLPLQSLEGQGKPTFTRSLLVPGSREEWPASGTMWRVISGQTFLSA